MQPIKIHYSKHGDEVGKQRWKKALWMENRQFESLSVNNDQHIPHVDEVMADALSFGYFMCGIEKREN